MPSERLPACRLPAHLSVLPFSNHMGQGPVPHWACLGGLVGTSSSLPTGFWRVSGPLGQGQKAGPEDRTWVCGSAQAVQPRRRKGRGSGAAARAPRGPSALRFKVRPCQTKEASISAMVGPPPLKSSDLLPLSLPQTGHEEWGNAMWVGLKAGYWSQASGGQGSLDSQPAGRGPGPGCEWQQGRECRWISLCGVPLQ